MGAMVSPLRGADGNAEFLLHARRRAADRRCPPRPTIDLDALVRRAPSREPTPDGHRRIRGPRRARRGRAIAVDVAHLAARAGPRGPPAARRRGPGRPRRRSASPEEAFAHGLDVAISLGGDGTMLRAVDLVAADEHPGHRHQRRPARLPHRGRSRRRPHGGEAVPLRAHTRSRSGCCSRSRSSGAEPRRGRRPERGRHREDAVGPHRPARRQRRRRVLHHLRRRRPHRGHPTGSTAYSFSARGPIVAPTHRCLVLTPVSPHMLFDRTLVLDPHTSVRLEVIGHRPATVSADGRNLVDPPARRRHRCARPARAPPGW